MSTKKNPYAWRCQECGYTFRSVAAAEKATYGNVGCPGCGGSDIDLSLPVEKTTTKETSLSLN